MISIHEGSRSISTAEKEMYKSHLKELGLDENIWDVYDKFLQVRSKYSIPRIIRIQEGNRQLAHFYMLKCIDYGATLSRFGLVKFLVKLFGVPAYSWIKSGIGAENNANPCYIHQFENQNNQMSQFIKAMSKKYFMLLILDLESHKGQYPGSVPVPYPDEGIVNTTGFTSIDDYLHQHKNLKKKFRHYKNHGGRVDIEKGKLSAQDQRNVEQSVLSTSKKSLFKLPYQDIYPAMCRSSSDIENDRIIHFICRSDDQFFGYHSFIQFNNQIRCLNGAFNRSLPTTYHAYENMIFKVVEYAIENRIQMVYFGPVLNETKKRMMNQFLPTRIYFHSKFKIVVKIMAPIVKRSRMVNREMLAFSGIRSSN